MSLIGPSRNLSVVCCALLLLFISLDSVAREPRRSGHKDVLPRVGTIKDYPATGLMTGCANLYFYPALKSESSSEAYIFLAHGDGSNAWMNLDGRDVRLQQIKSRAAEDRKPLGYAYRLGALRINVVIENFKPANATADEADSMFKMKITLRHGRTVRIIRAVGDSDC
jgi:hypothetical protein